jgi:uncharacterized protein (TIGR02145 family)
LKAYKFFFVHFNFIFATLSFFRNQYYKAFHHPHMKKIIRSLTLLSFAFVFVLSSCKKKEDSEPCTPPPIPTATNNSPVGPGDMIQLSAKDIPGASYQWTGPAGFSSTQREPSFAYSDNALGRYAVVAKINGCVSDTFYTYVTTNSVKILTVNGQQITAAQTKYFVQEDKALSLVASNVNGATFTWKRPGRPDTACQNLTMPKIDMAKDSGYYTVIATAPGNEAGKNIITRDSVFVGITVGNPDIAATIKDTVGSPLRLVAGGKYNRAGYTLHWKGPFVDTVTTDSVLDLGIAERKWTGEFIVEATYKGITTSPVTFNLDIAFSKMPCGVNDTIAVDSTTNFTYHTVNFGNQCWLKENIRKRNGTADTTLSWSSAMNDIVPLQGACPAGYHVPTDEEWTTLASGFSDAQIVTGLNITTNNNVLWTSTEFAGFTTDAYTRTVDTTPNPRVTRGTKGKTTLNLLRCIRD